MEHRYEHILNPVGAVSERAAAASTAKHSREGRTVVGLIDNSKPNVARFLDSVAEELRRSGDYEIVNVVKPRSAAPSPQLDALARRCDFVVNAVAD